MQLRTTTECPNLYLNSIIITKASEFEDLGVIINENLKFISHIYRVVAKASVRACLIRKCFVLRDAPTLIRAFKTYVRPILEYASCVWSPTYSTAIKIIETVQRKLTKRLPGYSHLNYTNRLERLNMESLELRRLHSDLILTYKINFGLDLIFSHSQTLPITQEVTLTNYLKTTVV